MAVGKAATNERVKLVANLFQSVATTSIAVGVLAPFAAYLYAVAGRSVPWVDTAIWLGWSALSHVAALSVLGRVRD